MTTKWEKEIPIKYKELFENYKNIEMFQSIYSSKEEEKKPTIEGFNFAGDDFNIHAERGSIFKSTTVGKDVMTVFNVIRDFILCPFYKSDQIIDNGLQELLKIFLAVECNDISLNIMNNNYNDSNDISFNNKIFDLTDLIDTELLYTNDENFENKSINEINKSINEINKTKIDIDIKDINLSIGNNSDKKVDCSRKKEAEIEIKKNSTLIRNEIYNILFLPIIIHIFYNCYYMLFHMDIDGTKPEFIDIETKFYNPNLKQYLGYFLDIAIKPLTYLYNILFFIANPADKDKGYASFKSYVSLTQKYPYIFFIILFFLIYSIISQSQRNIISIWGNLLLKKSSGFELLTGFTVIVMIIEFGMAIIREFKDWTELLGNKPISGTIKYIIYWLLRLVVNLLIFPIASYLCTLYLFVYLFFGIAISNSKDTFDVYDDINNTIYTKMYERFNNACNQLDWWGFFVKYLFRYVFLFIIEITILIILFNGINVYTNGNIYGNKIQNINVLSFLIVLITSSIFILSIWCFIKYYTTLPELNFKYEVIKPL